MRKLPHSKVKHDTMYKRLKNALSPNTWLRSRSAPLAQWADDHALSFAPMVGGAYLLAGKWQGRAVRIQCLAPSRPFIQGMELMARAVLGLRQEGNVVLMNRALKEVLEAQSRALYSQYTDELRTMAGVVPDEVRWLSMYRDAGWVGPDHRFWSRYAVLTDAPELARRWTPILDEFDRHGIDLPISSAVRAVLHGELTPRDGLQQLLAREQKPEYPETLFK